MEAGAEGGSRMSRVVPVHPGWDSTDEAWDRYMQELRAGGWSLAVGVDNQQLTLGEEQSLSPDVVFYGDPQYGRTKRKLDAERAAQELIDAEEQAARVGGCADGGRHSFRITEYLPSRTHARHWLFGDLVESPQRASFTVTCHACGAAFWFVGEPEEHGVPRQGVWRIKCLPEDKCWISR